MKPRNPLTALDELPNALLLANFVAQFLRQGHRALGVFHHMLEQGLKSVSCRIPLGIEPIEKRLQQGVLAFLQDGRADTPDLPDDDSQFHEGGITFRL